MSAYEINRDGWNLAGFYVFANYLGIPVSGEVTGSRVKYGGGVEHRVVVDKPYVFFDGTVRPAGSVCLIDHPHILKLRGGPA